MRLLKTLVFLILLNLGAAVSCRAPGAPAATGGCALECDANTSVYTVGFSCEKEEGQITYGHQRQESEMEYTSSGDLAGRRFFFVEQRTYATSKNAYWIWGRIYVNEIARTASYEIRATGGTFGSATRVCKSGQFPMKMRKLPAEPPARWSFVHRVSAGYRPSIQVATCNGANPPGLPSGATWACLASEKGDFVGQGRTWTYTPAKMTVSLLFLSNTLEIKFADWRVSLAPTMEENWRPGLFDNAAGFPGSGEQAGDHPMLEVSNESRSCGRRTGKFEIVEFAYDWEKQEIRSLAVNLEHSCDGGPPLRGYIRYNSTELH